MSTGWPRRVEGKNWACEKGWLLWLRLLAGRQALGAAPDAVAGGAMDAGAGAGQRWYPNVSLGDAPQG